MKSSSTAERLQVIMSQRNLRQVDILNLAKPYCERYNVKLGKNDLSQYVSGKVEPGQIKLSILGLALNVSEAWLMGYDAPMERGKAPASESKREEDANIIRIAGRDGSYTEKRLTDEQLAAVKAIIDQLPDADDL